MLTIIKKDFNHKIIFEKNNKAWEHMILQSQVVQIKLQLVPFKTFEEKQNRKNYLKLDLYLNALNMKNLI